jgi:hypothetical protein
MLRSVSTGNFHRGSASITISLLQISGKHAQHLRPEGAAEMS